MIEGTKSKREIILETALQHFADFGYEGAHVRKMLLEAGINTALAHYYFGSKEALYQSVIQSFIEPVLLERRANLLEWKQGNGAVAQRLIDLFAAYIEPHFLQTSGDGGRDYARFMQRELSQPSKVDYGWTLEIEQLRAEYRAELQNLLPQLGDEQSEFVMGALVAVMLATDTSDKRKGERSAREAINLARRVAELVVVGVTKLDAQIT